MDNYSRLLDFELSLPSVQAWPEMQTMLQRAIAQKDRNWQLPVLACAAVGGTAEQALPAMAAIGCLQISIILIDDLLDADPRGEYRRLGAPAVANLAAAFQAAGLEAILQCEAEPAAKLAAVHSLCQMAMTTALGQYGDTQNPGDEPAYWRIVRTKSAPFFGAALQIGALLGGASAEVAEQFKQIGCLHGEMIQIYDDLHDSMAVPANPDWTLGRSTLPLLFAQTVEHPDRARFLELRTALPDPYALAEAQTILVRCGAISYGVYQLLSRYQMARAALEHLALGHRSVLEALLEEQISPVREMFAAIGGSPPEIFNSRSPAVRE